MVAKGERVCRAPIDGCDTAEVCNGYSSKCPIDKFAPAGVVCNDGVTATGGRCYQGRCASHMKQCKFVEVESSFRNLVPCQLQVRIL